MKAIQKLCWVTALIVAAGCGGGSGESGDVLNDDQSNESTGLTGRLMMSNVDGKARIIDLSTGDVSLVPGVQRFGDPSGREYAALWKAFAHAQPYSGDRFVLTVDSCKFDDNDTSFFYLQDHCLALHSADGTELSVKKFYGSRHEIRGTAKLSRDGNYIAAVINDNWVYIYDSQFNVISRTKTLRTLIGGVVWRPDNSLLYYDSDQVFATGVLDTVGTRILKIETEGDGYLERLKVSPDGQTLAFGFDGQLHLMNLSNGDVRMVPVVEQLQLLSSTVTSWSPDGQSLMIYAYGTGLVHGWMDSRILSENIVIPVNFGMPGADGKPVYEFRKVMAKAGVWLRSGYTNENAKLEVLSENVHSYWLP